MKAVPIARVSVANGGDGGSTLPLAAPVVPADDNTEPDVPPPPPPPSAPPLLPGDGMDGGGGVAVFSSHSGHAGSSVGQSGNLCRGESAERHFEVGAGGEPLGEVFECPVCLELIATSSAAMRCTGEAGGRCHYFHAGCLSQWVRTQRDRAAVASCPICRGGVQVHAQRLEDFLAQADEVGYRGGGESKAAGERGLTGSSEERKDLEDLLAHIRALPGTIVDGWNDLSQLHITSEQLVEGASIAAGAGIGFYAGSRGHFGVSTGSWGLDRMIWENSSTSTKVATVIGYVFGTGYRWWSEAAEKAKEEEEHERQRSRGRS